MLQVIQHLIEYIHSLKRSELIETVDGQFLYSDNAKRYEKIDPPETPVFDRTVSNIDSFAGYILEVASRRGYDKDKGKGMTVVFNESRAWCRLVDDAVNNDTISYQRSVSPQWQTLNKYLTGKLSHKSLIAAFQALYPSFNEDYTAFMRHYRKVSFDEKITISSQPQVVDGKGGTSLAIEFSRNGNEGQTALPNTLNLKLQFTRDSKRFYAAELEIDSVLNANNREKPALEFSLLWSQKDNVIAQAVSDEIADFKALVAEKLPELLVVVNY